VLVQEAVPDQFYAISLHRRGLISYTGRKSAS